jgi:hypothetical protein
MQSSYLPFVFLSLYLSNFSRLCVAKIVETVDELPTQDFDFIVVGGEFKIYSFLWARTDTTRRFL